MARSVRLDTPCSQPGPPGAGNLDLRSERGFTMVELMVSALVVVLLAGGVAQGLIAGSHLSSYQRHHAQADNLAQQDQERLRGLSAKQLSGLSQTNRVTLDGTSYTVTSTASFLSSSGSSGCTSSGSGAAAYYQTTSVVSWTEISGSHSVKAESIITPPAGGTLLVRVDDQTGAALPGAVVNASGPDVEQATTDANGCVILAGLEAGTYTVTITDSGYEDWTGVKSPVTTTATVTGSGTAVPAAGNPIYIGLSSAVNVTGFQTPGYTTGGVATTFTTGASSNVSWYGSGSSLSMPAYGTLAATPSGSQSSTFPIGTLFPFAFTTPSVSYANNYQVWAGHCRQEQPPSGTDTVSGGVTPGSTISMAIVESAVNFGFTFGGVSKPPGHIKVIFTSSSGTSCTDSFSAGVQSNATLAAKNGWLADPGLPFASTATTGATASASGQTGTMVICADYTSGGRTYYGKTAAFQNNNHFASASSTATVSLALTTSSPQTQVSGC